MYAEVSEVIKSDDGFLVKTGSGQTLSSRALILATGCAPVRLGIPGEAELAGKGVSYCAICDGPFFSDFEVAVIGGGDSAVEEGTYLARFASKVHIVHRRNKYDACKKLQERSFSSTENSRLLGSVPVRIGGESK